MLLFLMIAIPHKKIVYLVQLHQQEILDIEKYGYSDYGIGFDRQSSFSFPGGGFGQNVLIFGADMSSSAHIE